MIRCPVCESILYRRRIEATQVDGCPSCGGVWLDQGELQTLARAPRALASLGDTIRPGLQPALGSSATRRCPKCAKPLSPFEYHTLRGVRLDRCPACEGVWLDHGEAEAIAGRLGQPRVATGTDPTAPAPSPVTAVAARFGPPAPLHAVAEGDSSRGAAEARPSAARGPARADGTSTAHLPVVHGRTLEGIDHSGGFVESLERGLRFIAGAYRLAFEKPALLTPLLVGALLQGVLVSGIGLWVWSTLRTGYVPRAEQWAQVNGLVMFAAVFIWAFAAQLINTAVLGMTVNMVDAHLKGLPPRLGTAFRDVVRNAGGVVTLAVVGTIVEMLTSNARNRRRGLIVDAMMRAVAETVQTLWTALSFLLLPIIIVEDVGLGTALRRTREIHGRGILQIAVGEVGLRLIAGLTTFALTAVLLLLGAFAWPLTLPEIVVLGGLFVVPMLLLGLLHAFARGAYYTCLYLWAASAERATEPGQVIVPAPLAEALAPTRR